MLLSSEDGNPYSRPDDQKRDDEEEDVDEAGSNRRHPASQSRERASIGGLASCEGGTGVLLVVWKGNERLSSRQRGHRRPYLNPGWTRGRQRGQGIVQELEGLPASPTGAKQKIWRVTEPGGGRGVNHKE